MDVYATMSMVTYLLTTFHFSVRCEALVHEGARHLARGVSGDRSSAAAKAS